jgi:N-acetylmuramoyl-L-alanine amidase
MRRMTPAHVAVAALLFLIALGVLVSLSDDDHAPKPTATTVTLGGPGHKRVELTAPAQAIVKEQQRQDAAGDEDAAHSDLHSEPPAASTAGALKRDKQLKPSGQPTLPAHPPLAAVFTPGCRTLLVRNYSSRQGAPILIVVLHFTVSTDNGWTGVLANVRWFDSPAAQASSNYILDRRVGACALTVAEASKAWGQAGFNRVALSIEVTARGNEGAYVTGAGRARLVSLLRRFHRVYKVPYRHGAVSGCSVTRTGYVMHRDLGACGGGHVDVAPYRIDDLIAEAARLDAAAALSIRAVDRDRCRKLVAWRKAGRPKGGLWEKHSVARKRLLRARRLSCSAKGLARIK